MTRFETKQVLVHFPTSTMKLFRIWQLCSILIFFYYLVEITISYLSYDTITDVEFKTLHDLEFPSVTICLLGKNVSFITPDFTKPLHHISRTVLNFTIFNFYNRNHVTCLTIIIHDKINSFKFDLDMNARDLDVKLLIHPRYMLPNNYMLKMYKHQSITRMINNFVFTRKIITRLPYPYSQCVQLHSQWYTKDLCLESCLKNIDTRRLCLESCPEPCHEEVYFNAYTQTFTRRQYVILIYLTHISSWRKMTSYICKSQQRVV